MKENLIVSRIFNAPVEAVWKLWTEPELIKRWWGPDRFNCPTAKINFREGGTSLVSMKAAKELGGQEWFSIWRYTRIVPLESIEFVQSLADRAGNKLLPGQAGMPADFPEDIRTIVTFEKLGDNKTEMIVTQHADMGQTAGYAKIGLEQSMDKMLRLFTTGHE
jgi:uncharacterized protein YndB with AHSA1/START domain